MLTCTLIFIEFQFVRSWSLLFVCTFDSFQRIIILWIKVMSTPCWCAKFMLYGEQACLVSVWYTHWSWGSCWRSGDETSMLLQCQYTQIIFRPRSQAISSENWYAILFLLVWQNQTHASIGQGSDCKPLWHFLPAPEMLQSNQIAEHAITTYWHPCSDNSRLCYSLEFVERCIVTKIQKEFEKQSELGRGRNWATKM